ncbi:MAG: class I SAM-dependent methyltransferase [Myxococcales bacterium]|nr:class I SAM-dependent methyltransferase [Myxococcales bacterium]MCB9531942.1 class I SAM-dependent methyltransferase [Myxococcales bacterium]MCB9533910.1 class I SAM-dependent methyltransferase [Myxococcales bacterium]
MTVPSTLPELDNPVARSCLASLYGRAVEAMHPDGAISDVEAVRVYVSLDLDLAASLPPPDGFHARRAALFDGYIEAWAAAVGRPATVIELGCGLETESSRLQHLDLDWVCIDGPDVIALRDATLPPGPRVKHVVADVRSLSWTAVVPPDRPVLVTLQGVPMYWSRREAAALLRSLVEWRSDVAIVFDTVTPARAAAACREAEADAASMVPPMLWGIRGSRLRPLLRRWIPDARALDWVRVVDRGHDQLSGRELDGLAACVAVVVGPGCQLDGARARAARAARSAVARRLAQGP